MVPSHIYWSPMPWALMHTHTITEACFFFAVFIANSLDGFFIESDICTRLTREHFPLFFSPSQITWKLQHKINKCLPFCIKQFQVAFLDAAANSVEWEWFSKVLPRLSGYVHHGSMTVSQTILPEGSKVTGIEQRFLALAFMHQYFLWLPESFHNIMNWWWNIVFELTDNSLTKFGTKWTTIHPCLQRLPLKLPIVAPFRAMLAVTMSCFACFYKIQLCLSVKTLKMLLCTFISQIKVQAI